jgi:hypothetical protein
MNPRRLPDPASKLFAVLSILAIACLAAACAATAPVGITKSEAMVAGCSKLGEVTVDKKVPDGDVNDALAAQARQQNGNYVVVASDGARTGVAYRCTTPSAAASR